MIQIVNALNEVNWQFSNVELQMSNKYVENTVNIIGQQRHAHENYTKTPSHASKNDSHQVSKKTKYVTHPRKWEPFYSGYCKIVKCSSYWKSQSKLHRNMHETTGWFCFMNYVYMLLHTYIYCSTSHNAKL